MTTSQPSGIFASSPGLRIALQKAGEPEAEFRPFAGQLVAGFFLAGLLVVVAVGLLVYGVIVADGWAICLGLMVLFGGAALGVWMRRLWGQVLFVCVHGLVRRRFNEVEVRRWRDIRNVVELSYRGTSENDLRPLNRYRIEAKSGASWPIDAVGVRRLKKLIALLRQKAEKHGIPWVTEVVEFD